MKKSAASYLTRNAWRCIRKARVVQRGARTIVGDQLMGKMKQSKGDQHAER